MDMARPRTLLGYISLRSTNTTALMEMAVQNTYSRKNVSMNQVGRLVEGRKYRPIIRRQKIIPPTPHHTSCFRPTLSMIARAITVVSIFTTPTRTVEKRGSSKPASAKILGP